MGGGGSRPKQPKDVDKSGAEAAERERKRLRANRGRANTILGGPGAGTAGGLGPALGTAMLGGM